MDRTGSSTACFTQPLWGATPTPAHPNALYVLGSVSVEPATLSAKDDTLPLDFFTRIPDVPPGHTITSVACGVKHCVAVMSAKEVWCFGGNHRAQCHPMFPAFSYHFRRLPLPATPRHGEPVEVACGSYHTLVRFSCGTVMSCGDDEYGQLGHGLRPKADGTRHPPMWREVALSHPATRIEAAGATSFAIAGGSVYSWGQEEHGSLGHGSTGLSDIGKREGDVAPPRAISWFASHAVFIKGLSASPSHVLAHDDRRVFAWGSGAYGKLGNRSTSSELAPVEVTFTAGSSDIQEGERVLCVAAGTDHSVVLKQLGIPMLYVFGKENVGGDGCLYPRRILYGVPHDLIAARCGNLFTYLWAADGSLYGMGYMSHSYHRTGVMSLPPLSAKGFPAHVECLKGKFVTGVAIGGCFSVCAADDALFQPPPDEPDNATLDVMVPKSKRGFASGLKRMEDIKLAEDTYERAVQQYLIRVLGSEKAAEYFSHIPIATPASTLASYPLKKKRACGLRKGSRVRIWVQDVYALGTIIGRDLPGQSAAIFEVQWLRDDWDVDYVDLRSDDEGFDTGNPNRWQSLWFLPPEYDEHGQPTAAAFNAARGKGGVKH